MDTVLLTKIISSLIYPLGAVSVLSISWLIFKLKGNSFAANSCALFAVVILFVSSNPLVASGLVSSLERQYPQLQMESISEHDAIIVLGGGLRIPLPPARHVQLGHGSDRYWYAAQLYREGKAGKIILSGGNVYRQAGFKGEAYYASQLLQQWGVPDNAIFFEDRSRTTEQNQTSVADLVRAEKINSILLVTSAIHMPRAQYLFRRLPASITPASADVLIREQNSPAFFNYLPSASALKLSTVALHEYYGLWYQWIKPDII